LYFIENVQGGIFYPLAESDVFIVGFNFVGSVLERDSVLLSEYTGLSQTRIA
jgi:hypothetical protein